MTATLLFALVLLLGVFAVPFLLDRLERRTVSAEAIVTHATRSRRTDPDVLESVIASTLRDTVAGVFGESPARHR
ncbi:MAG: hypothetical protein NVSMB12_12690 [Acidimicrobiales bacterium]